MRLVTFRDKDDTRIGVQQDAEIIDLTALAGANPPPELRDMLALIEAGTPALRQIESLIGEMPAVALLRAESVELLAPIPRPRKNIFCVGRNYAEHAAESLRAIGQEVKLTEWPNFFTKAVTTVTGPSSDILLDPTISDQLDWEVELGVVIGRGGRHIQREEALAHVFGYTVVNDVSARDIQHRPGLQWFLGKSLDGTCPMGPCLVTADEIPNPQALRLHLVINGVVKQESSTDLMLFDVAALIATLSEVLTLEPGDIIATGTPSGVGFGRTPQEFLRPGDLMESTIEGIGTLRNRIVLVER